MIWDAMQGIGALVGLITGAFVFREHLYRHTPVAYFVPKPLIVEGMHRELFLRIQNRSEWPIFLSWSSGIVQNEFRIARSNSSRGVVEALLDGERVVVLNGNEVRDFDVVNPGNFDTMPLDATIEVTFQWRFAQEKLFKRKRKIVCRLQKRDALLLVDEQAKLDGEANDWSGAD